MNDISTRDAVLELGTQLKRAFRAISNTDPVKSGQNEPVENTGQIEAPPTDTEVRPTSRQKNVAIKTLKQEIGPDLAFVKQTITNKLSEYGLPATTQLSLERKPNGELSVNGPVLNSQLERIAYDLNQDKSFLQAYRSVNNQTPTLDYVTNVTKLTQAYGNSNQVFESLLSEDEQFNRLQDITMRYQSMVSQHVSQQSD